MVTHTACSNGCPPRPCVSPSQLADADASGVDRPRGNEDCPTNAGSSWEHDCPTNLSSMPLAPNAGDEAESSIGNIQSQQTANTAEPNEQPQQTADAAEPKIGPDASRSALSTLPPEKKPGKRMGMADLLHKSPGWPLCSSPYLSPSASGPPVAIPYLRRRQSTISATRYVLFILSFVLLMGQGHISIPRAVSFTRVQSPIIHGFGFGVCEERLL